MAYRFEPGEIVTEGVKRIGAEQIDRAITELTSSENEHVGVHQARKRLKRARGLLRVSRPLFGKRRFKELNVALRDVARDLSSARDSQAKLEALAKLENWSRYKADGTLFSDVQDHLINAREEAEQTLKGANGLVNGAAGELRHARDALMAWQANDRGFGPVADGLASCYDDGRRAFARAYRKSAVDEDFHDWRKTVQRHWFHNLLVAAAWPEVFGARAALAKELAQLLGDDHDLYMLKQTARGNAGWFGTPENLDHFIDICTDRQMEIRAVAKRLGTMLFAARTAAFKRRVRTYWSAACDLAKLRPGMD